MKITFRSHATAYFYSSALIFSALMLASASLAKAADKASEASASPSPSATPNTSGEEVDVSKIQEKYWAQGKESELGVVQNRKYTYAGKFELELFGTLVSSDPFLDVKSYGLSLGYHFNTIFSLHAIAWNDAVSGSDALHTLQNTTNATADTNPPKAFYGLEADANVLYGKVSLFGATIIYVDVFGLAGLGETVTQSGTDFTEFVGLGQKIHLNRFFALQLDYKIMHYSETVPSQNPAVDGGISHQRSNFTDAVSLGVNFSY